MKTRIGDDGSTRPVRIGVVGLRHGMRHVVGFHTTAGAEVTAVCDLDTERAQEALRTASPGCRAVSWTEMFEGDLVDAVVVSLPNDLHATYAREALQAGVHVAVEKPLCTSGVEAHELAQMAQQQGLVLAALHDFRVERAHWMARELVRRGVLGQVYAVRTRWLRRDNAPGAWYRDRARAGGGVLLDLGTHRLDLALWMLDFPQVLDVRAATSRALLQRREDGGDVEDSVTAWLELDGGVTVHAEMSFLGHLPRAEDVLLELRGTEASLRVSNVGDSYRDYDLTVFRGGPGTHEQVTYPVLPNPPSLYRDFVAAVATGTSAICPGGEAAAVAELIDRLYTATGPMNRALATPVRDRVLDVDLDTLMAPSNDVTGLRTRVEDALHRHDLRVHLIVLCHGTDPQRFATTARLCRALGPALRTDRVELVVSYQGGPAPHELTELLAPGQPVWSEHPELVGPDEVRLPETGKTEHVLACLGMLRSRPGDPGRRFVVFLDSDYLVYDPVDALALYAPWALGFASPPGGAPAEAQFSGAEFAKGSGLRLVVDAELTTKATDRTLSFLDLLDAAMAHAVPHAPAVSATLPTGTVPTPQALRRALEPGLLAELTTAMGRYTQAGGRSSRGLSQYLASRNAHPLEQALTRFPFLLHGDQGATLAAWSEMPLAPGYGLELSFLTAALRLGRGRVVSAVTLPHAHLPKNDRSNFALGVDMFALLQHLIGAGDPGAVPGRAVRRASATALGYRFVDLAPSSPVPALYPPLTAWTTVEENRR
ncbi:Gfo/Idh/MocA family protein [Amycolatopsis sp. NPDC058278]|uniref:Gfo/Idh/MocA family protein n=1 Tax=Amycolatopsis sp. NPDC058278 TaxID=3346417 RepID=UPI0036DCA82D